MNFEADIEWVPDAGLPRRSLAQTGGITEISRWCQPPVMHGKCGEPRRGDGLASRDVRSPCRGLSSSLQTTGGLHHRLTSDVPPGRTCQTHLKPMTRSSLAFVVAVLLVGSEARADWTVASSKSERTPSAGVEHRRIVVTDSGTEERATIELALFSMKSATLRVVD